MIGSEIITTFKFNKPAALTLTIEHYDCVFQYRYLLLIDWHVNEKFQNVAFC